MKCDLEKKLLLLPFMLYLILNVESMHEVNGTSEENITVKFTFQDYFVNNSPILYKNDEKKESCKQSLVSCLGRFVLSDVENSSVTLHITNLSREDQGLYHLVVLADGKTPFIQSNKIHIKVKLWNKTTENICTPPHEDVETNPPKLETSEQKKSFIIFFSTSVIICICLFVGILFWFYRTYPRKPDAENPAVQNNRTTQQGQCGRSGAVVVSCVEYGELDFQNRPGDDRVKPAEATSKAQDGVEYAAIIFPQQKHTPGGRMRNKQQVHAIK